MGPDRRTSIELEQDCEATLVPSGHKVTLRRGETVTVTQALGSGVTIETDRGDLARIDAAALGREFAAAEHDHASAESRPFALEQVIEQLKTVFDPEIPVNVLDLGLIYACDARPLADGGHLVEIKMSMTAPGCGMGDVLKDDARRKVQTIPGVSDVEVELVWDPPWDPSRMSDAARLELGML